MTQMKFIYRRLGGHYHVSVFTRTLPTETYACCGIVVFDEKEWPQIRSNFSSIGEVALGED